MSGLPSRIVAQATEYDARPPGMGDATETLTLTVISVRGVAFLTGRAPDRGRAIAILLGVTTTIRLAVAGDAAAVARIYNEGIEDRLATFETRSRTAEEVAGWLDGGLPFLVAEDGGEVVVGFARVSPYSDRCVYDGVGEHGVYVARSARGAGLGRMLLEALCDEASGRGFYKLTSRVFTDNEPSRAVHVAAGFEEVGIQRRHGRLDGRWKDCVLVERLLGDAARWDT